MQSLIATINRNNNDRSNGASELVRLANRQLVTTSEFPARVADKRQAESQLQFQQAQMADVTTVTDTSPNTSNLDGSSC